MLLNLDMLSAREANALTKGPVTKVDVKGFIRSISNSVRLASHNRMVQATVTVPDGGFEELPKVLDGLKRKGYRVRLYKASGLLASGYFKPAATYLQIEWSRG